MPVLAAIKNGLRHSIARNTPHAKCISSSLDPQNQPSLVKLTSTSGSAPLPPERFHLPANEMRERAFETDVGGDSRPCQPASWF